MLGKLVKYEIRASGRLIPLVYLAVVLLTIAGLIAGATKAYVYFAIAFGLLFLAGAVAMIVTYIVVFFRFNKGMYANEGYLAMTLPVKAGTLYLSKYIVAFGWLLFSFIITAVTWGASFFMLFQVERANPDFVHVEAELAQYMGRLFSSEYIVMMILSCLVGYLSFVAEVFFCITLSNMKPFHGLGIGGAVIAYLVLGVITQILSGVFAMFIPISLTFNPDVGWYMSTTTMFDSLRTIINSPQSMEVSVGLGTFIMPVLYAILLPIITVRLMERKVNLK